MIKKNWMTSECNDCKSRNIKVTNAYGNNYPTIGFAADYSCGDCNSKNIRHFSEFSELRPSPTTVNMEKNK